MPITRMCQDPDRTNETRNSKPGLEFQTWTGKISSPDQTGAGPIGPGPVGSTRTGRKIHPGPDRTGPDWTSTRALVHVCLSACLLVCLAACLLVCLAASLLVCLSACLLVCLSACLLPIRGKHKKVLNLDSRGSFETLTSAICRIFQN